MYLNRHVVNVNTFVFRDGNALVALGVERDAPNLIRMVVESFNALFRLNVPNLHRPIRRGRHEARSCFIKGDAEHPTGVPGKRPDEAASRRVV